MVGRTLKFIADVKQSRIDFLRKFGRDEDGSIIVLTILLLLTMLVLGGMGVDFMRFESRRTMLQNTADVAVLAAAELDQLKDPKAVVIDYFEKAGFADAIIGEPDVLDLGDYTSVGVKAQFEMNTFFLKFAGIKTLAAPAQATAVEGVANIEVSLVVDISGSMRETVTPSDGSAPTETKIQALRTASKIFASTLLTPTKYRDKISLSLVPYTDQVNAGPTLFNALNVPLVHNYSHCLNFQDSAFSTLAMPAAGQLSQSQHFQSNPVWDTTTSTFDGFNSANQWDGGGYKMSHVDSPTCPQQSFERIVPLTQNYTTLSAAIDQLQPRGSTSIFLGLKWGTALLDPSMRSVVTALSSGSGAPIDSAFAGRPANYPIEGVASATQKVLVVMTDGKNDTSHALPTWVTDTPLKRAYFANTNFRFAQRERGFTSHYNNVGDLIQGPLGSYNSGWTSTYVKYTPETGDLLFSNLCDIAKDSGIILYTVAVEAAPEGRTALADCASSPSHFFDVSGDEMASVFQAIAKQITELRLSL